MNGYSRVMWPANRSLRAPSNSPAKKLAESLASTSPLHPIRCVTDSPCIYWNPAPISGPFSCCSATAAWQPPHDTYGLPPARCVLLPVHSTCFHIPSPLSPNLSRLSTSERRVHGSTEVGNGGRVPPLREHLSRAA